MTELKFNLMNDEAKTNLLQNLDRARLNLDSMGTIVECHHITQNEIIKELEESNKLIQQIEDYKLQLYHSIYFFI